MGAHRTSVRLRVILLGLLGITLINTAMLFAQVAGSGTIQGTVLDPTGAVIPGASVTATNPQNGTTITRTSTDAGFYVLSPLPPAEYTVTVTAKGFRTTVQDRVLVDALSVVGLNVTMTVGSTNQEVTVSAAPPTMDTENGTLGTTINNDAYTSLPFAMSGGPKSPEGFIYLLPGVANGSGFVGNVNGGEAFSKEIYVNGLPLTTSELQGDYRNITTMTSVEVVDQFQILTSGAPAYYDGQGTENFVFKSGTNKFHGDGYEFVRNESFDSRGFFSATVPIEKQNEFGGTFGGPIKKNKIFFFGNYDGYRFVSSSAPSFDSFPTAQEQQGNFTALPVTIYDPATTTCVGTTCTRTAFSGNIIPTTRFSSVSKALAAPLTKYSLLNTNLQNNYLGYYPSVTLQNDETVKGDFNVSDKTRFFLLYQHGLSGNPTTVGGTQFTMPLPYASGRFGTTGTYLSQANVSTTITPTLVNVFAGSWNRFITPYINATTGQGWGTKAGLTGLPGAAEDVFPEVDFGGPNSPTNWAEGLNSTTFIEYAETYTVQDNLQWVKGKHSVTFGGVLTFQRQNELDPSSAAFSFSNLSTSAILESGPSAGTVDPTQGNAFASYLLGNVIGGGTIDSGTATETGIRMRNYSFYAQDDFKVTPRLTLNLGLRYGIPKPFFEEHNRNSFLNATLPNPAADGYPGAIEFFGYGPDSCGCQTPIETHYKDFAPRIGLAYKIGQKTVVRASYGLFYYNTGALGGASGQGLSTLGYSASPSFNSLTGGITPAFDWDSGFPAYAHPPFYSPTLNAGYNTQGTSPGSVSYADPRLAGIAPRTQNWNFTIERELSPSTVLKVSYAGSNSHFLPTQAGGGIYSDQLNPEYLPLGALLTSPATPANIAAAQAINPAVQLPYANFAGNIAQMLLPFPQYVSFSQNWGSGEAYNDIGNGNYNSLQMSVQRRFSHGLQFLISYTLSKEIDDAGSNLAGFFGTVGRTGYNTKLDKAVGLQDVPNQLVFSYVYDFPIGKGHQYGNSNKVLSAVVSDWKFSGIQQYVQGTPIGPIGANCESAAVGGYTGAGGAVGVGAGCYASYAPGFTGPVKINGSIGGGGAVLGASPVPYLNIAAYTDPPAYGFGDVPRTDASRLRNTTWLNENFSLARDIKATEFLTLHIAADAFNAFNRTQFSFPNTGINSGAFGLVGGQANSPRQFQFDFKIMF